MFTPEIIIITLAAGMVLLFVMAAGMLSLMEGDK
jgi:hypothetical protein